VKEWVAVEREEMVLIVEEKDEEYNQDQKKKLGFLRDEVSKYSYLPVKKGPKKILYGS